MPKTYNHLYTQIASFDGLYEAYQRARRQKRYRDEVLRFRLDLEGNLLVLLNELLTKTYRTGRYRFFHIYEPKRREVAALPFRDRIVQHALCRVIEPLFERKFIADSFACRVDKGTHAAADRLIVFLREAEARWGHVYALKADIAQYFPSINHAILQRLLRRTIACRDTLWLMDEILHSTAIPGDPNPCGLPIGNLTSQLWANVYLNELDHFVKETLRVRHYLRYMDDFVLLSGEKAQLRYWHVEIATFLHDRLALRLNPKTTILSARQGVPFVGYLVWADQRKLRRSRLQRLQRCLTGVWRRWQVGQMSAERALASVMSWLGHLRPTGAQHARLMNRLQISADALKAACNSESVRSPINPPRAPMLQVACSPKQGVSSGA